MNKVRNITALLLALLITVSMCACGNNASNATHAGVSSEQVTQTQTVYVEKTTTTTTTVEIPAVDAGFEQPSWLPEMPSGNGSADQSSGNQMPGTPGTQITSSTDTSGEIVYGITENSAMDLEADYANAITYDVSEDSDIKISEAGTYIVTGTSSDGNITVKKGTTGVVLILKDLDLTSTTGATVSINKGAEAQIIISGNVTLTDNENPEDEESTDTEVADAFDGAAIKVKAGSIAYITGDGTLTINGNAKNGIKVGDEGSLIIGGEVSIIINAANDGINANYDLAILSGNVTITAADDAIHADHILTIGVDGSGPTLTIKSCTEGLEGTVVNILGGKVTINATDDGINAANKDALYADELTYSVNILGGDVTVKTSADGIDSNGNVNLIAGSAAISSASVGGDAGIDYDGALYISEEFNLNNASGVAGSDGMGGMAGQMGGMPGQMSGMSGQMGGFSGQFGPRGF